MFRSPRVVIEVELFMSSLNNCRRRSRVAYELINNSTSDSDKFRSPRIPPRRALQRKRGEVHRASDFLTLGYLSRPPAKPKVQHTALLSTSSIHAPIKSSIEL